MPDPTTLNIDIVTKADTAGVEQARKSFAQLGDEIEQQSKKGAVEGGGTSVPGASAGAFGPFGKWVAGLTAAGTAAVLLKKVFSEMAELNPRIGEGVKQIKEALHDALTPDWLKNGATELGKVVESISRALGNEMGKEHALNGVNPALQQMTFMRASRMEQERMVQMARERLETLKQEGEGLKSILEVEREINRVNADDIARRTSDEKGRVLERAERIRAAADQAQKQRQDVFDAGELKRAEELRKKETTADQAVTEFDRNKAIYEQARKVADLRRAQETAAQAYANGGGTSAKADEERFRALLGQELAKLPREFATAFSDLMNKGTRAEQQFAIEGEVAKLRDAFEKSVFSANKAIEERNSTAQRLQIESSTEAELLRMASEHAQKIAQDDIKVAEAQAREGEAKGRLAADTLNAADKLKYLQTQLENLAQRVNSAPLADALRTVKSRMDENASERDFDGLLRKLRELSQSGDRSINTAAGNALTSAYAAQGALNAARADQMNLDRQREATDAAKTEAGLRTANDDLKMVQGSLDAEKRKLQQNTQDINKLAQDMASLHPDMTAVIQQAAADARAGDTAQISELMQNLSASGQLQVQMFSKMASDQASFVQQLNELQQRLIMVENRSTDN